MLEQTIKQVVDMNREHMLIYKQKITREIIEVAFITGFNMEYKELKKKTIREYWPIVRKVPHLSKILTSRPKLFIDGHIGLGIVSSKMYQTLPIK